MRIMHLSDLHLRDRLTGTSALPARQSRSVLALLQRALADVGPQQVDALVLSGDVLDYPLAGLDDPDLQRAGLADLARVRALLDPLPCPWLAIPGNHDHPQLFQQVFGDTPRELSVAGYRIIAFADAEDADHVPHRTGREWARLAQALSDDNALPQIHVQHFVVWPELNIGYPHTYAEQETLRAEFARSQKVMLVLSGHYHAGTPLLHENGIAYATVPALCESPYPYRLYDVTPAGVVMAERCLGDGGSSDPAY